MKLTYIEMAGFRGFLGRTRIGVPRGFLVLTGRNGTGKSTVIDAVEFVLTGGIEKYPAEVGGRENVSDYLWWRGPGKAESHFVALGLETEDGRVIELARSRDEGPNFSERDIEDLLCQMELKPARALYQMCRTSIIRDEQIASLSWDQTDTARFEFVRSALGALAPSDLAGKLTAAIRAAEKIQEDSARDAEVAAARLRTALGDLAEAKATAQQAQDLEIALEGLREFVGRDVEGMVNLLTVARARISERRVTLQNLSALREEIRSIGEMRVRVASARYLDELSQARSALEASRAAHETAVRRLRDAEGQLASEEERNRKAASLAALAEHGKRVGLEEGVCPLCRARREEHEYHQALGELSRRVEAMAASLVEARNLVRTRRTEEELARVEVERAGKGWEGLEKLRSEFGQTEAGVMAQLARLGAGDLRMPGPEEFEERLAAEGASLARLEQFMFVLEASQSIDRVARLEAVVVTAREESDKAASKLSTAERAVLTLKEAEREARRVSGEIVDERLAAISPLLSELYYRLRPHRNWRTIDYAIRGDVRRFLSLRVGEGLNPQFVFSSGERRAAGLAFLLAVSLSRPWCKWQTLLLDDPVQHIDDFRALHLVEVLSAFRKGGNQIVCAVEDPQLADLLCRRLRSTAESPGARVELDYSADSGGRMDSWVSVQPLPTATILQA